MKRVLKFSASWCQPCKMLAATLETITTDVPVSEIDIDDNEQYAREFGIRGVPTMVMLDGNTEIKRKSGMMTKSELEAWLNVE
ncbi:thioredoxin [uncultured Caudovirales phage]|uniref:Thioredoxin n=1 Tax=uncultured Caudovirales phage TaxID=2100421 RepID=A0A6J5KPI2_9CAUD|nr:thioredoxin [uncultured Caudovirales phage]